MDLREIFACSACGVPMDWADAHLRVSCGCHREKRKTHSLTLRRATEEDTPALKALCLRFFQHTDLITFGQRYELTDCESLVAVRDSKLTGLISYVYQEDTCLVVAFAVAGGEQARGVGAQLQDWLEGECLGLGITRMILSTTNDNLPALYFYQRHGFHITQVLPNEIGRALEEIFGGHVPDGFGGIPIRDEVRLEKQLSLEKPT